MAEDLWKLSACTVVARLRAGTLDALELTELALARIAALDPELNAVPTLVPERARAAARRAREERSRRAREEGWLGGLPVVIKDTHPVAGVRTTWGSTVFADHVPVRSAPHVRRLEERGAVILGKSNTPEFAAGAQTFNEVFGTTVNPWDRRATCGGSSGGGAAALAAGMAWLADGSDFGGSLRIPAAFCGVVGLRPSPGRVPQGPRATPFQSLDVIGPMARGVNDLALLLDALSGAHEADPISLPAPAMSFARAARQPSGVRRVAACLDLGPSVPVDAGIGAALDSALARIARRRITVQRRRLGIEAAIDAFAALRAVQFAAELGPVLEGHRDRLKPELVANIEAGLTQDGRRLVTAEQARGRFLGTLLDLFGEADILALPTTIIAPFPVTRRYPEEVGGVRFPTYFHWAAPTLVISLTGCPAISLPVGLTSSGMPVGLQLVAPPRADARLLAFARELEADFGSFPSPLLTRAIPS